MTQKKKLKIILLHMIGDAEFKAYMHNNVRIFEKKIEDVIHDYSDYDELFDMFSYAVDDWIDPVYKILDNFY